MPAISSCQLATPVLSFSSCVVIWPLFVCVRCVPGAGRRRRGGRRGTEERPRFPRMRRRRRHLVDTCDKRATFFVVLRLFCRFCDGSFYIPIIITGLRFNFCGRPRHAGSCVTPQKRRKKNGVKKISLLAVCCDSSFTLCVHHETREAQQTATK